MILKVWQAKHVYMVRIRNDYYEMNSNANMPNGVCIYYGTQANEKNLGELICDNAHSKSYKTLPLGLRKQISHLS